MVMGQTSNLAVNPNLYSKLPYDSLKDFMPVTLVSSMPIALMVWAKSPYLKLSDLIEAAKTREDLDVVTQSLDRVLRSLRFWIPQWYKNVHTVAFYDQIEHPETLPPYGLGEMDFWWFNAEKAEKLKAAGVLK